MKKINITIPYNAEKFMALEQYMLKKDVWLVEELDKHIQRLYEKYVPQLLREYIDAKDNQEAPRVTRPIPPLPAQGNDEKS